MDQVSESRPKPQPETLPQLQETRVKMPETTTPGLLQSATRWIGFHFRRGQNRVLPSADTWDAQYESGRWTYLGQLAELSRYSVLVGYMLHFKPGGAVLDVGCGEGVLLRRLEPHGYSRYVGVDLSSSAITALAERHSERLSFFAADGEHYVPTEQFDIIVFNEVLYFFHDPLGAVERYASSLRSGGILLVSICTAFKGGTAILDRLKRVYTVLDETRVTHADNPWSWICVALATQPSDSIEREHLGSRPEV
jgi:SAM-dependent methyltransferase